MPPVSRPSLPRPPADRENLQRLRQRAFARLELEEQAATHVTRRWSLQRLALVAAGLTPGIGALLRGRPAAASTRVGARCGAPQYGAPGVDGNARYPVLTAPLTRGDIASLDAWTVSNAYLVAEGTPKHTGIWNHSLRTRTANYTLASGQLMALALISDPAFDLSYIVAAKEPFYVAGSSGLYGVRFGTAELILSPAVFKFRTQAGGDAEVVARFAASISDKTLSKAAAPEWEIHIPIGKGLKPEDWKDGRVEIYNASFVDGVLEIGGYGPGPHSGTFSFDIKARKFLKYEGK